MIPDIENGQQHSKQKSVRYPCDYCNHQSKSIYKLKDHKATIHKIDPVFRCLLCDYCTNHTTAWKIHARQKHPKFEEQEIFTETRKSDRKIWSKHRVGLLSE